MHFISTTITTLVLLAGSGLVGGQAGAEWPGGGMAQGRPDAAAGPDFGTYEWPVSGPVLRPFEAPPLRREWEVGLTGDARTSSAVAVTDLAVANGPDKVVAFHPTTGEMLWSA